MLEALNNLLVPVVAATPAEDEGGTFLVTPNVGLMIWTLVAFLGALWVLRKFAFPRIQEALDKRAALVAGQVEAADRTRKEAEELLAEYRERLREAREQAEDIVARSRKAADRFEEETKTKAKAEREELLAKTRRDIEQETRRALDEIRKEVATLTIAATEKVMRKSLDGDDQKRLVEEALAEVDFSALAGADSNGGSAGS